MAYGLTPYGEKLGGSTPLSEYPRPQMVRSSYFCLNGPWDYAIAADELPPAAWAGEILVPFAPESTLSGVGHVLQPTETLWYKKRFTLPRGFVKKKVLLHFGAVDQRCVVYINGTQADVHAGGYLPFSLDITKYLLEGEQEIVLAVRDETDAAPWPRGRQRLQPGGAWHTPQSGIWQTVWLESVPQRYIKNLRITPQYDDNAVDFLVESRGGVINGTIQVYAHKTLAGTVDFRSDVSVRIPLVGALSWHPGRPFLYSVKVFTKDDKVESYFGMRKISIQPGTGGHPQLMLNNKPFRALGVVDQGLFSDGLYTPPSDDAMLADIRFAKDCGFNIIRKHGKIEPLRWYHHCDQLGMLVWQDLPAGGGELRLSVWEKLFGTKPNREDERFARFGREDEAARDDFVQTMKDTSDVLYNSPCVVAYSLFQNGQGQFSATRLARQLSRYDKLRLVDHASGKFDQGGGAFTSTYIYNYASPLTTPPPHPKRALLASETGGFGYALSPVPENATPHAIKLFPDKASWCAAITTLYSEYLAPFLQAGGSGFFLYQLSDAEDEVSGLLSFDRRSQKLGHKGMASLNSILAGLE